MQYRVLPMPQLKSRLITFLVGFVAAATLVYWFLRIDGIALQPPVVSATPKAVFADIASVSYALGSGSSLPVVETDASSDWRLLGVVQQGKTGAALLYVGAGEPVKTYVLGSTLPQGWVLSSVQARQVVLTRSGQVRTLELAAK